MEISINMDELKAIIKGIRTIQERDHKIMAATQGVEWPGDEKENSPGRTFEEIQMRAAIKAAGGNPDNNDVVDLRGAAAEAAGFGINIDHGLSYEVA